MTQQQNNSQAAVDSNVTTRRFIDLASLIARIPHPERARVDRDWQRCRWDARRGIRSGEYVQLLRVLLRLGYPRTG